MARCVSLLGSKCRGRIGDKTYYVRHGQQIVYERSGKRHVRPHLERYYFEPKARKIAKVWAGMLRDEGIIVDVGLLENFVTDILGVFDTMTTRITFDTKNGAWSYDNLRSLTPTPTIMRNSSGPSSAPISTTIRYETYGTNYYAIDAGSIRYNNAVLCSFVGDKSSMEDAIVIHQPTIWEKATTWGTSASNPQLMRFADARQTPAYLLGPAYTPKPTPYKFQNVRISSLSGDGVVVYPWLWVDKNGTILHAYTFI